MRGIIFTELLDMAEKQFGYETVDKVLSDAQLESNGVYTSVGHYAHDELVELLVHFSKHTGLSIDQLQEAYAQHLFGIFVTAYSDFFKNETSALDFLAKIETKIHPQVLKLYPDAELPSFDVETHTNDKLVMVYKSGRKMGHFAHGLILGCLNHFGEKATVDSEDLSGNGERVRFTISKTA